MAIADKVKALVAKVPELDPNVGEIIKKADLGKNPPREKVMAAVHKERPDLAALHVYPRHGKFTGPSWEDAVNIVGPILEGGKEAIVAVIDMLQEVDDGKDYKARYVLHVIAQYCCRADKQEQQDMAMGALCSQVGGDRPKQIQKFLLQQLQVCGDKRVAGPIGKLLTDEDVCDEAALALLAIGGAAAVEQFRGALTKAKGKARLTAVQNLGVLRDAASAAALREAAGDADKDVQIAAVWALANLGDAASVDILLKAADTKDWQRVQATKACLMLAEKLAASGKKNDAKRIYTHLRDTRKAEPESYIRQAAIKALEAL